MNPIAKQFCLTVAPLFLMQLMTLCRITALILLAYGSASLHGHEKETRPAGVVSLDVCASAGRLHLLVGMQDPKDAAARLEHLWSTDGGITWSKAVRVDADNQPAAGLHRGMDAQIAASGDHLVAVWQIAGTDSWGGGPMAMSLSSNGGKTWKSGPNPADDGSTEGHNFIDIAADEKGVLHLVWLDTRDGKRGLRSAKSEDHGLTWSVNRTVDAETCECCWNTIASSPGGGTWVIYRDKSPRDMTAASLDERDAKPITVGNFQWEFPGCPHVGAGLCLAPDRSIHAVVWTGKEKQSGIYHLASTDRGQSWSAPSKLGDDTARNPDCAAGADGSITVVWNSMRENESHISTASSRDGGRQWSQPLALAEAGGTATHPRIANVGSGFRIFWTETAKGRAVWRSAPVQTH